MEESLWPDQTVVDNYDNIFIHEKHFFQSMDRFHC